MDAYIEREMQLPQFGPEFENSLKVWNRVATNELNAVLKSFKKMDGATSVSRMFSALAATHDAVLAKNRGGWTQE